MNHQLCIFLIQYSMSPCFLKYKKKKAVTLFIFVMLACTKPVDGVLWISDWLLKLRIVTAIHPMALFWILRASFPSFHRKKGSIWYWLSTGLQWWIQDFWTGGGWQNNIVTIGDKVASVIVLFICLISSLNDPKRGVGVASHPIYPLWIRPWVWYYYLLFFTSVSVKSGGYFPHHFAAWQISTIIHLHFGE